MRQAFEHAFVCSHWRDADAAPVLYLVTGPGTCRRFRLTIACCSGHAKNTRERGGVNHPRGLRARDYLFSLAYEEVERQK